MASKSSEAAAKPMTGSGPPASKTMIEPIMPTMDVGPYLPVDHVTSRSVRKIMALCIIGSPVNRKPSGATVRFKAIQKALKKLINAKSNVDKYLLLLICFA